MHKKETGKKTLYILLTILLLPAVIINVAIIASHFFDSDHIPGFFGYKPVIVLSGSMKPVFYPGDLILIDTLGRSQSVQEQDIICFQEGNSVITHRVIAIQKEAAQEQYVTKGDANSTQDVSPVASWQVEGVYRGFRIAGLGSFALFAASTPGILLLIVLPLILFFLYELWMHRKQIESEKEENDSLKEEIERMKQEQIPHQ